jgi:hypothetical protein
MTLPHFSFFSRDESSELGRRTCKDGFRVDDLLVAARQRAGRERGAQVWLASNAFGK